MVQYIGFYSVIKRFFEDSVSEKEVGMRIFILRSRVTKFHFRETGGGGGGKV
jgi:hypothetical protein